MGRFLVKRCIALLACVATQVFSAATLEIRYEASLGQRADRTRYVAIGADGSRTLLPQATEGIIQTALPAGRYALELLLPNKDGKYARPRTETVELTDGETTVFAQELIANTSRLTVTANMPLCRLPVFITDSQGKLVGSTTTGSFESPSLETGNYTLEFSDAPGYKTPAKQTVWLQAGVKPSAVRATYLPENAEASSIALASNSPSREDALTTISVLSNVDSLPYTIYKLEGAERVLYCSQVGSNRIAASPGKYVLVFDEVLGFEPAEEKTVDIGKEGLTVNIKLVASTPFCLVPKGPVIVGDCFGDGAADEKPSRLIDLDAFYISQTCITNSEYADWLTQQLQKKTIYYVATESLLGQVFDKDPNLADAKLLCETVYADGDSGIQYLPSSAQGACFKAVSGKERHPVVEVTWAGAMAYAAAHNATLPTEAQWERAAGMEATEPGAPLRKWKYGTSANNLRSSQACYLERYTTGAPVKATRPVAFYNGINLLEDGTPTIDGKSPFGLYDMSGNVRQWVYDWYAEKSLETLEATNPQGPLTGILKVCKGGSWDSVAFATRTSAREAVHPATTDAYTGFRIVKAMPSPQ